MGKQDYGDNFAFKFPPKLKLHKQSLVWKQQTTAGGRKGHMVYRRCKRTWEAGMGDNQAQESDGPSAHYASSRDKQMYRWCWLCDVLISSSFPQSIWMQIETSGEKTNQNTQQEKRS